MKYEPEIRPQLLSQPVVVLPTFNLNKFVYQNVIAKKRKIMHRFSLKMKTENSYQTSSRFLVFKQSEDLKQKAKT